MEEKKAIVALWDQHWDAQRITSDELINARYVQEAFRRLTAFVSQDATEVIEVGCGTGRLCALLAQSRPGMHVVGLDLSPVSVNRGKQLKEGLRLPNVEFVEADLFALPYADSHFDVVFSEGVIQHFRADGDPSREASIEEMLRVLKPGGTLIVAVVNWHCYPHTIYKWLLQVRGVPYEYGYEHSFTRAELERLLTAYGLGNVRSSAYYPAHGFLRLSRHSKLFARLGGIVDSIPSPTVLDACGFEIMVAATKI